MSAVAAVTGAPTLRNSQKVKALAPLDSAASWMMTLLAAARMVRFPATVLPDARASHSLVPPSTPCDRRL